MELHHSRVSSVVRQWVPHHRPAVGEAHGGSLQHRRLGVYKRDRNHDRPSDLSRGGNLQGPRPGDDGGVRGPRPAAAGAGASSEGTRAVDLEQRLQPLCEGQEQDPAGDRAADHQPGDAQSMYSPPPYLSVSICM